MTYDRPAIMRHAGRLMRECGLSRSQAMKQAWAAAKAGTLEASLQGSLQGIAPKQQQAGIKAAFRRYGMDLDGIAIRMQEAARIFVSAIAQDRVALLPPPSVKAIDLTRGTNGVYRI